MGYPVYGEREFGMSSLVSTKEARIAEINTLVKFTTIEVLTLLIRDILFLPSKLLTKSIFTISVYYYRNKLSNPYFIAGIISFIGLANYALIIALAGYFSQQSGVQYYAVIFASWIVLTLIFRVITENETRNMKYAAANLVPQIDKLIDDVIAKKFDVKKERAISHALMTCKDIFLSLNPKKINVLVLTLELTFLLEKIRVSSSVGLVDKETSQAMDILAH